LAKSGAIIDVGGGLSRLPDQLAEAGHSDVTVLDVSAEAVRRMQERLGQAASTRFVVSDVTAWRSDRLYDLWHDRAVLHFLTDEADRAAYRRVLLHALALGGQAIIATFAPSGPETCSGLTLRRYGTTELLAFLGNAFVLAEAFEFNHLTPGGRVQRFHITRLVRR
jgi:trans-aconitate methyltransferase